LLADPENFIPANSLVTPTHIQPEWYFLFAYAILRSIPNKIGGVLALVFSLVVLLILPLISFKLTKGRGFNLGSKIYFWVIISSFLVLT
jgi:ubiquinol-cytochrome c reductase cytochrome b subunit